MDSRPDHGDRCICRELGRYSTNKLGLLLPSMFSFGPRISQLLCDMYLGCSQLNDTRFADDQDEQHDDDPAEDQIVSRHLQQVPF